MRVGILGLGYVGLPLAAVFAEAGHEVLGIDSDRDKVAALAAGHSTVDDVPDERLAALGDRFTPSVEAPGLADVDAILICVPTPLSDHREPDLSYVESAARAVAEVLREGQLVVLESTTYPGTTRESVLPILERTGLTLGEQFFLAFSPERVDPGRTDYTIRTTPKVVGGMTPACQARAEELYGSVCDQVVPVSTPEAAEMTKLLENIFRSVNIALVNELAQLADRMGIDIWEVTEAAATKPFGFMSFEPGPGMGGHCLPIDPFYLVYKAREHDFYTEFIELAGKLNTAQPYFCVEKIQRALNDRGQAIHGARVLLLGVSYKAGVGDLRESPALKIAKLLRGGGAEVAYHDPHVAALPELGIDSQPLADALGDCDVAVIVTAHPTVDHNEVIEAAPLVIDLRGITRGRELENVVRL